MITALRAQPMTIAELVEEFQVTTRTVRRDLVALRQSGVAVRVARRVGYASTYWVEGE
jgi:DeoR/GlpR family transcriptional regulator of sugar metabolism